jgi:drug/metabolite transporter superfamily protein YnfA
LWIAEVISAYLFTRKHWSERVALITAGMIATGRLFIWFVASPTTYLAEYASIMILAYLFDRFVVEGERSIGKVLLFASVLGIFSLTYDIFPFYFFIVGYGLLSKVNWKTLSVIIIATLLIYGGLIALYTYGLGMRISNENSRFIGVAIRGLLELIRSGDLNRWFMITISYFGSLFKNFIQIFLVLPVVLALLGLFYLKGKKQVAIILLFLVPAFLLKALLQFGNSSIHNLPRFYYIAYPGVYILASIFLDQVAQAFSKKSFRWLAWALPLLVLSLIFLLNNIDVWGIAVF